MVRGKPRAHLLQSLGDSAPLLLDLLDRGQKLGAETRLVGGIAEGPPQHLRGEPVARRLGQQLAEPAAAEALRQRGEGVDHALADSTKTVEQGIAQVLGLGVGRNQQQAELAAGPLEALEAGVGLAAPGAADQQIPGHQGNLRRSPDKLVNYRRRRPKLGSGPTAIGIVAAPSTPAS